ncbi:hypothetical protein V6N13_138989, partial [Hibiscus sabdariffa]
SSMNVDLAMPGGNIWGGLRNMALETGFYLSGS